MSVWKVTRCTGKFGKAAPPCISWKPQAAVTWLNDIWILNLNAFYWLFTRRIHEMQDETKHWWKCSFWPTRLPQTSARVNLRRPGSKKSTFLICVTLCLVQSTKEEEPWRNNGHLLFLLYWMPQHKENVSFLIRCLQSVSECHVLSMNTNASPDTRSGAWNKKSILSRRVAGQRGRC